MTPATTLRRAGAPLTSSVVTALLLTAVLSIQHARSGWPFSTASTPRQVEITTRLQATSGDDATHRRVSVEADAARSIDTRLETVGRHPLTQAVRAVATIVPDESRISHVHTRVAGWIEQLDVNTTGEIVRAGQPLARIFSQELLSSQTEYLAARRNAANAGVTTAVVASGRTRLGVFGMTPADIDAMEQSGEPTRLIATLQAQVRSSGRRTTPCGIRS